MRNMVLLKANFKRHKVTMLAIFMIMFLLSLSIMSVLSIWLNSNTYVMQELDRMQYGDITAWTQGVEEQTQLIDEIEQLQDVEAVSQQQLIYSDYQIGDKESDSEGQLVVYDPQAFPYRIFNEEVDDYVSEEVFIEKSEVYISASLCATYGISIGDEISFLIGRSGNNRLLKVKGIFEDPFMGSSMIGMKSFLIAESEYDDITEMINQAGIDVLARTGQMLHIMQDTQSTLNNAQFNQLLNEQTSLKTYTTFVHSKDAIAGFMLILQNAFTGLFLSFSFLLLVVSCIIVGYSVSTSLHQDQKNLAILKSVGYQGKMLKRNMKIQYLTVILVGMISGMVFSLSSIPIISERMISFAGIKTPDTPHFFLWIVLLFLIFLLFYGFLQYKTRSIHTIPPIAMMQDTDDRASSGKLNTIQQERLLVRISLRQLISGKKRYISVGITAILLVFFISMIGRMNAWLGPDGKGMMDAFHPADLDLGVQMLGQQDIEDMEAVIQQYASITDVYALAMQGVVVEGVDYTANVISEPERFHIQQGATIQRANEVVITQTIAADRDLQVHDEITISSNGQSAVFIISGIYQCANNMGGNIGMSREGFQRIANESSDMWCYHYFLEDTNQKQEIINALDSTFGGDVYLHENTWPGLLSIITAMQMLLVFMYVLTICFVFIVTIITGNKIFFLERRNLSIYKALGFTTEQLRISFALRYGIVAIFASMIGMLMSSLISDTIVGTFMNAYGISNYTAQPGIVRIIFPGLMISVLFMFFAYLTSKKMKELDINELIAE